MTDTYLTTASEQIAAIYKATEETLLTITNDEVMQLPVLSLLVIQNLKISPELMKDYDPFIRHYTRNHPDYHVSRGPKGGVMHKERYLAKEAIKDNKGAKAISLVKDIFVVATKENTEMSTTEVLTTESKPLDTLI